MAEAQALPTTGPAFASMDGWALRMETGALHLPTTSDQMLTCSLTCRRVLWASTRSTS